jgi:hypothetical protein
MEEGAAQQRDEADEVRDGRSGAALAAYLGVGRTCEGSAMTTRYTMLGVAMVALAATACQYDRYTAMYATKKPDPAVLFGTWTATKESLKDLAARGGGGLRPKLAVLPDGRVTMQDIPNGWRSGANGPGAAGETFEGLWRLDKHQDWWGLSLEEAHWVCSGCLMVLRDKAPHGLVLRYGDPDEGIGVEFERPSNNEMQRTSQG